MKQAVCTSWGQGGSRVQSRGDCRDAGTEAEVEQGNPSTWGQPNGASFLRR